MSAKTTNKGAKTQARRNTATAKTSPTAAKKTPSAVTPDSAAAKETSAAAKKAPEETRATPAAAAKKTSPVAKEARKTEAEAAEETAKTATESVERAVETSAEAADKAVAAGTEGFVEAIEAGNQAFTRSFDQAMQLTKAQLGRYYPDATKGFDELAAAHKGNVEALFAAQAAAAKGAEAIGEELYAFNRKAVDAGLETVKAMFGARSVQDAIELQSGFARERFEDLAAGSAKLSELTIKVSKEAAEPISARLSHSVEKAMKPVAG